VTRCLHCHKVITLDPERDMWIAEDGTATDSIEERRAVGTARGLDMYDVPLDILDGKSYREATYAGTDPLLSGHLMPYVHLPEVDFWFEGWGPRPDEVDGRIM
jgi:hypothetical protein